MHATGVTTFPWCCASRIKKRQNRTRWEESAKGCIKRETWDVGTRETERWWWWRRRRSRSGRRDLEEAEIRWGGEREGYWEQRRNDGEWCEEENVHSRLHREREATRKQRASRRKEEENQGWDGRCRDRGIQNASDSFVTFRTNARRSHLLQHCQLFFSPQTSNQSFYRRQNKELLTKLCFVKLHKSATFTGKKKTPPTSGVRKQNCIWVRLCLWSQLNLLTHCRSKPPSLCFFRFVEIKMFLWNHVDIITSPNFNLGA